MQENTNSFRLKDYVGVFIITFAAFIVNTSEFMPIGLLSNIASDFKISEATAGFMITMYAWVVALISLPLMLIFARTELKKLMLCVLLFFICFHCISALAHSYSLLMASRVGIACSHAIFWSIAAVMAVRAAPEGKKAVAISFVATGTAMAFALGVPLGRVIGLYISWRQTFLCIGLLALICLVLLWKFFPAMPSSNAISFKALPKILQNKNLRSVYFITALLVSANFTAYSYIEPFLAQTARLSEVLITWILIAFGAIGLLASIIFSRFYENYPRFFVYACIFCLVFVYFILHFASYNLVSITLLCIFWGFWLTVFNLSFQAQVISLASFATPIAMSMFSGIYNVGIGSGALIGGFVTEDLGLKYIGYISALLGACACVYMLKNVSFRWIRVNVRLVRKHHKQRKKASHSNQV